MHRLLLAACLMVGFGLTAAPASAQAWGDIKGKIVWGGENLPEPKEIDLASHGDKEHCKSKGKLCSEEWTVNPKNKGIRWVFVWLAPDPEAKKPLPIHPDLKAIKDKELTIDQPCCKFEPHALGLREGQTLIIKNTSPVAHNSNYNGNPAKNPGKNVLVQPGDSTKVENLKADRFPVTVSCNLHGWMKGYVRVFDHPYFVVTDENGTFEIKNAPAGDWRLMVWNDNGWRNGAEGKDGEKVTIKAGAATDMGDLKMGK